MGEPIDMGKVLRSGRQLKYTSKRPENLGFASRKYCSFYKGNGDKARWSETKTKQTRFTEEVQSCIRPLRVRTNSIAKQKWLDDFRGHVQFRNWNFILVRKKEKPRTFKEDQHLNNKLMINEELLKSRPYFAYAHWTYVETALQNTNDWMILKGTCTFETGTLSSQL